MADWRVAPADLDGASSDLGARRLKVRAVLVGLGAAIDRDYNFKLKFGGRFEVKIGLTDAADAISRGAGALRGAAPGLALGRGVASAVLARAADARVVREPGSGAFGHISMEQKKTKATRTKKP